MKLPGTQITGKKKTEGGNKNVKIAQKIFFYSS